MPQRSATAASCSAVDEQETPCRARFLALQSVTKRFGTVTAVDRIDLEIERGEFFALLGPSGSGKTTMLRIIAGLEQPDEGRVVIGGRDVTALPPYARHIGMVFQNFLLFPHKTAAENIVFPLRMQRRRPRRARRAAGLGAEADAARRARRPLSQRDVRRPAAARGAGARPDLRARRCCCSTSRSPISIASCARRWRWRSAATRRSCRSPSST